MVTGDSHYEFREERGGKNMDLIMSGLKRDGGVHQSRGRPSTVMLCVTNEATFKSPRDTLRLSLSSIVSSFFSAGGAVALGGLLSLSDPTIHATDP